MAESIVLLGSTGSIGVQTLDVCRHLGIRVAALVSGGRNVELMREQVREFQPEFSGIGQEAALRAIEFGTDIVVNAISGGMGLEPTLAAINAGKNIALANKESLVCAGERIMKLAAERGVSIIPVDSEHSAIFQCIGNSGADSVRSVILTASGGPFRGMSREQMENVSVSQALAHPSWQMGAKVTIDSATLMNKGLEFIEAMRLFSLKSDQIRIVVHPESIIHSAVEMTDGAVIAQLGAPDMRLPIQYALTYPERLPSPVPRLDLLALKSLTFFEPDYEAFPLLRLAIRCADMGDEACARLSEADEKAVGLFLKGEIRFGEIFTYVSSELGH